MNILKLIIFIGILQYKELKIPIFLIPHSHDDLGWLKTIDEYYDEKVKNIFKTTIESLLENNSRKFVYAETGFLKIFLESNLSEKTVKIAKLKKLILEKKWEFVNGGISQADTACSHYEDLIENLYYGLLYLKRNLDTSVSSGWQIDPFGHSKTFSYILALFGMKDMVINRIGDDKKKELGRFDKKNLSFNWKFEDGSMIRTHVSTTEYDPPVGMDCDIEITKPCDFSTFDRFATDFFFAEYNMKYTFAPWYFFGDDFYFANAENNFKFADQVIQIYDNLQYALFSDYVKHVEEQLLHSNKELLDFTGDFFVYTQEDGSIWSGFYTTKPDLKLKIRKLGKLLRSFKHYVIRNLLDNKKKVIQKNSAYLDIIEDFGYLLHHDTITGTSVKKVDEDYYRRIENLNKRIYTEINELEKNYFYRCDEKEEFVGNIDCSDKFRENKDYIYYTVFNPSPINFEGLTIEFLFLRNISASSLKIEDENGTNFKFGRSFCSRQNKNCFYFFNDSLQPFQKKTYKISYTLNNVKKVIKRKIRKIVKKISFIRKKRKSVKKKISLNFENYDITIELDDILIKKKDDNKILNRITFWKIDSNNSDPYILDYGTEPRLEKISFWKSYSYNISKSNGYNFFYIQTPNWSFHITNQINEPKVLNLKMVFKNTEDFKEKIDFLMKIENPNLKNDNVMETDSNGYFVMKREKNEKFEKSVFPSTAFVKIKDIKSEKSMTIFTDRSQGVINDKEGSLMIYLQRSTKKIKHGETLEVDNPFYSEYYLLNVENENIWKSKFLDIINIIDIDFFKAFHEEVNDCNKKVDLIKVYDNKFEKNLRINIDFVDENKFLVRMQNLNRSDKIEIKSENVMKLFKDMNLKEVPFSYPFLGDFKKGENIKIVDKIEFLPLQFRTYLVEL